MPFFSKRKSMFTKNAKPSEIDPIEPSEISSDLTNEIPPKPGRGILRAPPDKTVKQEASATQPQLIFSCQLAHGSTTGRITGFTSATQLYQKIAEFFNIPESSIIFCTLNTHRIDMNKLLAGQIGLDDLIFAHVKGQPKEIEFVKSEATLGLTITDNGAGHAFIKRIKEGSICQRLNTAMKVGDLIEKINDRSVIGVRHFEVATILKNVRVGSTMKIRLIEPISYDFPFEPVKRNQGKSGDLKTGKKTIRFKSDGKVSVEDVDDNMIKAMDRINVLLDNYMGINDADLSRQIWDIAQNKTNPSEFATAIDESELGSFNFSDEFIFDLWAAIGDVKAGRVATQAIINERL